MLGVPPLSKCPTCGRSFRNRFEEYDIECGRPNPRPGIWNLDVYCHECDTEFKENYTIHLTKTI